MRIAYAGTPAFAATGLQALLDAGADVALVLSQPDRPAGRGQQLQASPVKQLALARDIEVVTPPGLRPGRGGEDALARLRAAQADVLVVAAYGIVLPESVLTLPRGLPAADGCRVGAVNIHASLLPRWRGAAPVVRAIEAGDARTGITIMQMDAGLDTGPILATQAMDIAADATGGSLTQALAELGGRMIVTALADLAAGRITPRAQPAEGVTYAAKVSKAEAWVDWSQPAACIAARIRAFDPFPGACASVEGSTVKFWRAQPHGDAAAPAPAGTILRADAAGVEVACGDGRVLLTSLQRAGGRRLEAREFLAGMALAAGMRFGAPPA